MPKTRPIQPLDRQERMPDEMKFYRCTRCHTVLDQYLKTCGFQCPFRTTILEERPESSLDVYVYRMVRIEPYHAVDR